MAEFGSTRPIFREQLLNETYEFSFE